jgi:hypothetical protein
VLLETGALDLSPRAALRSSAHTQICCWAQTQYVLAATWECGPISLYPFVSVTHCHVIVTHCYSLSLIVTHYHFIVMSLSLNCPLGAAAAALHHRSSHSGTCNVRSSYRIAAEHKPCSFEPESLELAATELVPLREGSTMQWPFSCGSATEPPKPYSFELESRVTCSRTRGTGGRGSGPSTPWLFALWPAVTVTVTPCHGPTVHAVSTLLTPCQHYGHGHATPCPHYGHGHAVSTLLI